MKSVARAVCLGSNSFSGMSKGGNPFSIDEVLFLNDSGKKNISMSVDMKSGGQQIMDKADQLRLKEVEVEYVLNPSEKDDRTYLNLKKMEQVK